MRRLTLAHAHKVCSENNEVGGRRRRRGYSFLSLHKRRIARSRKEGLFFLCASVFSSYPSHAISQPILCLQARKGERKISGVGRKCHLPLPSRPLVRIPPFPFISPLSSSFLPPPLSCLKGRAGGDPSSLPFLPFPPPSPPSFLILPHSLFVFGERSQFRGLGWQGKEVRRGETFSQSPFCSTDSPVCPYLFFGRPLH